jgi:hypothetical protein
VRFPLWLGAAVLAVELSACFTSPDQQQVQSSGAGCTNSCHASGGRTSQSGNGSTGRTASGGSTGGASIGGTTTGGASVGGTTGGGATAGSSTGGGSTGSGGACQTGVAFQCNSNASNLMACTQAPPCGGAMCAQVCDELAQTGLCGVTVEAVDDQGLTIPGYNATTLQDGSFSFCPPPQAFSLKASPGGYDTTYSGQLVGSSGPTDKYFEYYGREFPVFSDGDFVALASTVLANSNPSTISIIGISIDPTICGNPEGFALSAVLADGDPLPDGGSGSYALEYVNNGFPEPSLTQTTDAGNAFIALDSTLTDGFVQIIATPVDPAPGCDAGSYPYANAAMTGLVYVAPGSFSATQVLIGP